jgi:hypothetical protein
MSAPVRSPAQLPKLNVEGSNPFALEILDGGPCELLQV